MSSRSKRSGGASRRPGRPRGGSLDVGRDDMLAAAERLIRRDGPGVTMEAIAAASSVTKPSLYRTVGDRRQLVADLARRFSGRVNDAVTAALEPTIEGRNMIRQIFRTYLDVVAEDRDVYLFVISDEASDDRIARVLGIADVSAAPMAQTLRAFGVDEHVATSWAYAVVGATQYATFQWLRDQDRTADEVADQLTELLWSGIGTVATGG